jgi:hypothetical protein
LTTNQVNEDKTSISSGDKTVTVASRNKYIRAELLADVSNVKLETNA